MKVFLFLILSPFLAFAADEYDGSIGECGGTRQSPINIDERTLVAAKLPPLIWSKEYLEVPVETVVAGGHSLVASVSFENSHSVPLLTGGPLSMPYRLEQFHFHWSQHDTPGGSEHTLNGHRYLAEMHAVHVKVNLTFEEAVADPEGIAVVGYFYEYGLVPDASIANLMTAFPSIRTDPERPVSLRFRLPLKHIMPPIITDYVTYEGSLTTPPCTQNVRWILSRKPNKLSKMQMYGLRRISSGESGTDIAHPPVATDNYRTLQPINGRTINVAVL